MHKGMSRVRSYHGKSSNARTAHVRNLLHSGFLLVHLLYLSILHSIYKSMYLILSATKLKRYQTLKHVGPFTVPGNDVT